MAVAELRVGLLCSAVADVAVTLDVLFRNPRSPLDIQRGKFILVIIPNSML